MAEVAAQAWLAVKPHYEQLDAAVAPRVFAFAESLGLKVRPISPLVKGLPLIDSPTPLLLLLVRPWGPGRANWMAWRMAAVMGAAAPASRARGAVGNPPFGKQLPPSVFVTRRCTLSQLLNGPRRPCRRRPRRTIQGAYLTIVVLGVLVTRPKKETEKVRRHFSRQGDQIR